MQTAIWTIEKYNNFDKLYPAIIALYHDVYEDWSKELGVIKGTLFQFIFGDIEDSIKKKSSKKK